MDKDAIRHLGMLLFLSVLFGTSFLAIKVAVATLPPMGVVAGRLSIGMVVGLSVLTLKGIPLPPKPGTPEGNRAWRRLSLIAVMNMVLPFYLISWGETRIPSSHAAFMMGGQPMFALFLAHFTTTDDRFNSVKAVGVVLGFVGLCFIMWDQIVQAETGALLGYGAVILAAGGYVVGGILSANTLKWMQPQPMTVGVLVCSSFIAVPLFAIQAAGGGVAPDMSAVLAILYLGVFPTGLAFFVRFALIRETGFVYVSQVNYIVPLVAAVAGFTILDENLNLRMLGGALLVFVGVYVTRLGKKVALARAAAASTSTGASQSRENK